MATVVRLTCGEHLQISHHWVGGANIGSGWMPSVSSPYHQDRWFQAEQDHIRTGFGATALPKQTSQMEGWKPRVRSFLFRPDHGFSSILFRGPTNELNGQSSTSYVERYEIGDPRSCAQGVGCAFSPKWVCLKQKSIMGVSHSGPDPWSCTKTIVLSENALNKCHKMSIFFRNDRSNNHQPSSLVIAVLTSPGSPNNCCNCNCCNRLLRPWKRDANLKTLRRRETTCRWSLAPRIVDGRRVDGRYVAKIWLKYGQWSDLCAESIYWYEMVDIRLVMVKMVKTGFISTWRADSAAVGVFRSCHEWLCVTCLQPPKSVTLGSIVNSDYCSCLPIYTHMIIYTQRWASTNMNP